MIKNFFWRITHQQRLELVLVVLVLSLAFFLRFYNLFAHIQYSYDQGRDLLVLEEINQGDLKLVGPTTGLDGIFIGPFIYYLLWPAYWLSQGNPYAVAAWNAFLVSITLPFFYFLLKPLTGRKLALFGLLLMSLAIGSIEDAKLIWNPSLAVPTILVAIWATFKSLRHPSFLAVGWFFYGLSLQTELAYSVFLLPLFMWWTFKNRDAYSIRHRVWALLAFGSTLIPQIAFEIKHGFFMTQALVGNFQSTSSTHTNIISILAKRPDHIFAVMERSLFGGWTYSSIALLLITWLILGFFLKRPKDMYERFVMGLFLLPLVGFLSFTGNSGNFFSYYVQPHYLAILASLILALKWLPRSNYLMALILLIFACSIFDYRTLILNPNVYNSTLSSKVRALELIRHRASSAPIALELFVPNLKPEKYRFVMLWLNRDTEQPRFIEGNQDSDQYFLVYELGTDTGSEFAFKNWYERITSSTECYSLGEQGITYLEKCQKVKVNTDNKAEVN